MSSRLTVNQKLEHACQLMQEEKYEEAVEQFLKVVAVTRGFH